MVGAIVATSTTLCFPPQFFHSTSSNSFPTICFLRKCSNPRPRFTHTHYFSSSLHFSVCKISERQTQFYAQAQAASSSSAASAEYVEEPATNVKFQTSLSLPGCSDSLTLFGTGYREKVFAIIGVKVYAAGLYLNQSITSELNAWKGQPEDVIQEDSSLFKTIYQSPFEKSLQIILVRDVDGKTFWDALDDAVSPRIKSPTTEDETALSTFRRVFQDRPLKKGTFIFLTWLNPSKMLVFVSPHGFPSTVDATIESANVASALFDVFLGDSPVSPTLKSSVAKGLSKILE
ncbi:fatty-acid-binding protein 3, chloroplastic [Senna tora]|uniref:Chalcone-flavonone isomerase family protein n=1 Tax=Senna tora TaxID=362788 RepID=A0A835CD92_9FABA|nr:fatty-acid-binding protein 3, chloroplastic [Senna tora]